MPFAEQFRALLSRFSHKKRKRRKEGSSSFYRFLEESRSISILVFAVSVVAIVTISFVGIKQSTYQFLPNQLATTRIVAAEEFSYPSKILQDRKREEMLNSIPQVYRIDMTPFETFKQHIEELVEGMERYAEIEEDLSVSGAQSYIARLTEEFNNKGNYRLSVTDLKTIVEFADIETQKELIETGLISLQESYRLGIFDPDDPTFAFPDQAVAVFHIVDQQGTIGRKTLESMEVALRNLRVALNAENVPRHVAESYTRLFDDGLKPNLKPDKSMRNQMRQELDTIEPVIVTVEKGTSIIERDTRVTPEQYEQLVAYRRHLEGKDVGRIDFELLGRVLLVMSMLVAVTIYIRLQDQETLQSNTRLALLALVVICNLFLVRVTFELGNADPFLYDPSLSAILPYITPTALAPIIIAVLLGSGPGLLTALMISLFSAVMFGNRLDLLIMSFLASCVAIYVCQDIRKRGRVVVGGTCAGMAVAAFTALFNLVDQLPTQTIINQSLGGLVTGLAQGIVAVGILPILEHLFKRTTDITLLELSDYNHPLLRRMQLEAPGTWHHSLMVSNLAENACNAIGANGLLARVCCMFHDIGKMVKPEYFTENQLDGHNPHDQKTPSFSALVIKSHVKEGVDLGLTYKLPKPVIDVIRQHHGTNLIRYFHHKAKELAKLEDSETVVQESTYRYDGPRPRFKESGVILLADSIEAASRSLPKVTPQAVEELIDRIFELNIRDGQLDECPINMAELARIRESFNFTILNSLHSRIAYPSQERPPSEPAPKPKPKPQAEPQPQPQPAENVGASR